VLYRFAACELDPRERRLLVHDCAVTLTPKVFDTLLLLVERAGHVVSKDELMAALWPRGFVHESNLTKHIWLIRRALGEEGGESHCIETVPKLGYRFIAPVSIETPTPAPVRTSTGSVPRTPDASPAAVDVAPVHPVAVVDQAADTGWQIVGSNTEIPASSTVALRNLSADRRRRTVPVMLAVLAGAVLVTATLWWHAARMPEAMGTATPGNAIAIVDFNNLSNSPKDAWLAPALTEMLGIEITAGGRLHAIPDELVRTAQANLPAAMAGGYAPQSLARLQQRLGSDYVLSGSYLVFGSADAPQLRLDLAVQDARSGAMLANLSRSGAVAELPTLVVASGATLRDRLGIGRLGAGALQTTANAQPPTAEVARHLGFALDALQNYDPARARDELLQAIAQAPGYAPAYMYLAQAWSSLGYRAKALAASRQALANAQHLPDEQRLQIEAQQDAIQGDRARTIETWRKLVALRPQNPEYRLKLAAVLVAANRLDDTATALVALRQLPGASDDPRVELVALDLASARGNAKAVTLHAERALQLATARAEPGLVASAQLQLGMHSGDNPKAESLLRSAAASFKAIGNPHGEALSYQNLGNTFFALNQIPAARESYERAMAIYQGIGDLGGQAAIYDNLSRMLWAAGDRDGTEAALKQALQIGRETNDPERQAWSLTGLATVLSDESASDEVVQMYRQALALDEQAGSKAHHVFALAAYADLLRERGELDLARSTCAQGQAEATALGDPEQITSIRFECAQIALDRGEVDAVSATFTELADKAKAAGDTFTLANSQLMLGQIAMGQSRWTQARNALRISLDGWTASQEPSGQAEAEAMLALCYAALHDTGARDNAAARARDLRSQINQPQEILTIDITLAQLADQLDAQADTDVLQSLGADALRRQWRDLAMEAQLAVVQLLERRHATQAAAKAYATLWQDAGKYGFGWVQRRLAFHPPQRPGPLPH
jgi:DNA-binding winged-HTH domains